MRTLVLLTLLLVSIEATVIKLFDRFHFYEILIQKNQKLDTINSFKYIVHGEGICFAVGSLEKSFPKTEPFFDVKAAPLIYSNYEQTLSFLNQVEFKVRDDLEGKFRGFQLEFESLHGEVSCVQIIPDSQLDINFKEFEFTFTIKDPITIDQKKNYIFFFGRVHLKALIDCQDKLCVLDYTKASSDQIGVYTEKEIGSEPLAIDLCDNHVLKQTCIKQQMLDSKPYLFIIHPLPNEFDAIYADLNVLELDEEHKALLRNAIKQEQTHVQIGDGNYSTKYLTEERGVQQVMVHNIVSYQYQKLRRDIIIKLLPKVMDIKYLGILKGSNANNTCPHNTERTQCYCKKTNSCNNCYSYMDVKDSTKWLNYVPLDATGLSRACRGNHFFDPYEFEGTQLRTTFQSQSLANHRKPNYPVHQLMFPNNNIFFNRNSLPSVCFKFRRTNREAFNIALQLTDHHRTAQNSLFDASEFELKVYSFEYANKSMTPDSLEFSYIETALIAKQIIKLTEPSKLQKLDSTDESLTFGKSKYLIEIVPKMKNDLCPDKSQCVDEAPRNNEIQCVTCNKLVIFLSLTNSWTLFEGSNSTKHFDSLSNNMGKCVFNDPDFENILWVQVNKKIRVSNETIKKFQRSQIVSGVVPSDFIIESAKLPIFDTRINNHPFISSQKSEGHLLLSLFIPLLLLAVAILGFLCLDVYFKYKAKECLLKMNYKKKVLFYISINVNNQKQEILKELLKKYDLIKEIFPDITFNVITFSTNKILRTKHLEEADLICYICCSPSEIENLSKPIEIGLNAFQHEYNRIQSGQYKWKSLNMTFNRQAIQQNDPEKLRSISVKKSTAQNSEITMSTFLDKTATSGVVQSEPNLVRYLTLPQQNMEFVWMLMPQNDLNLIRGATSNCVRPLYALYTCLNSFYKRSLSSISYHSYKRQTSSLYCKYLLKIKTDKISDEISKFLKEKESVLNEEISNSENLLTNDIEDDTLFADELDECSTIAENNKVEDEFTERSNLLTNPSDQQ